MENEKNEQETIAEETEDDDFEEVGMLGISDDWVEPSYW